MMVFVTLGMFAFIWLVFGFFSARIHFMERLHIAANRAGGVNDVKVSMFVLFLCFAGGPLSFGILMCLALGPRTRRKALFIPNIQPRISPRLVATALGASKDYESTQEIVDRNRSRRW